MMLLITCDDLAPFPSKFLLGVVLDLSDVLFVPSLNKNVLREFLI